jgi:FtsZ-interacting cell division protein YlmF
MKTIFSKLSQALELSHPESDEDYVYDDLWQEDNPQSTNDPYGRGYVSAQNHLPERIQQLRSMNSHFSNRHWQSSNPSQANSLPNEQSRSSLTRPNNAEIVIKEFEVFEDAATAVQQIRERKLLVLNLKKLSFQDAQRALDFMAGSICITNGSIERISDSIFIFTPHFIKINSSIGETDNSFDEEVEPNLEAMSASQVWGQAS